MPVIVGTNSYISVAEADAYLADLFGKDHWESAPDPLKGKALVSATQLLDSLCTWDGEKVDPDQKLAFPMKPDADPVPQDIKNAQAEIASDIIATGSTTNASDDKLEMLKAGSVTIKFDTDSGCSSCSSPVVSDYVFKVLGRYGYCAKKGGTTFIPMELQ